MLIMWRNLSQNIIDMTVFMYVVITILLVMIELLYFVIADKFNIIDKPNERSSHKKITLRGGGILFLFGAWSYSTFFEFQYPWFLVGLTLVALISFIDDIHSLPDSVRLVIQFVSIFLMFYQLNILHWDMWWIVILAMIVCVGIINVYNFMDGINGLTGGYSLVVLISLLMINQKNSFVDNDFLTIIFISILIFCFFNFRKKAKCFAGDVGSVSIAFILLFILGNYILITRDVTWLILLVVYGVDACMTIVHRIMLHENLGKAHRKHVYQIMANELHIPHVGVSIIYMLLQLVISLIMVYVIPSSIIAHWIYLLCVIFVLIIVYVIFMKRYYHLHEEYLKSIKNN